jgi:hypothetical protein
MSTPTPTPVVDAITAGQVLDAGDNNLVFAVNQDNAIQDTFDVDVATTVVNVDADLDVDITSSLASLALVDEIKELGESLSCEDFKGLGTLGEYETLIQKVGQLQDFSRTLSLTSTANLTELSDSAESIEEVLNSITLELSSVSTLDDTQVLTSIKSFLTNIGAMVQAVKAFRIQITATATIQIPGSIVTVTGHLEDTREQIECVKRFLDNFTQVTPLTDPTEIDSAVMTVARRAEITSAEQSLELIRSLGDANINSTDSKVAALAGIATQIATVDFNASVQAIRIFKNRFAIVNLELFPHFLNVALTRAGLTYEMSSYTEVFTVGPALNTNADVFYVTGPGKISGNPQFAVVFYNASPSNGVPPGWWYAGSYADFLTDHDYQHPDYTLPLVKFATDGVPANWTAYGSFTAIALDPLTL